MISGVALAVILSGVRHISDTVFLEAAKVNTQRHYNVRAAVAICNVNMPGFRLF